MTDKQRQDLAAWADQVRHTTDDAVVVGGRVLRLLLRLVEEVCE